MHRSAGSSTDILQLSGALSSSRWSEGTGDFQCFGVGAMNMVRNLNSLCAHAEPQSTQEPTVFILQIMGVGNVSTTIQSTKRRLFGHSAAKTKRE
jgi:hypothetical protein